MVKIERVIKFCTDCNKSKEFVERGGNTDFILVCTETNATLLRQSSVIKGYHHVDIPESCPLEDYKPKN